MKTDYFADAKFNFAWEIPFNISLFDIDFNIVVSADAYYATDKVTDEQNNAFKAFFENSDSIINHIEKLLLVDSSAKETAIERFVPKFIKIKRNGDLGIVFDDKNDFENGLVISVFPKYELLSTDEYF